MDAPSPTSFSRLLRQYRRQAGLSQEQLAERADISRRTVSDLERGVKVTPQAATLELLVQALDLSDEDRKTLLSSVPKRRHQPTASQDNLVLPTIPADVTTLVGREREEAAAIHLLRAPAVRLLTLIGPGGVGKTRLATRIAATMSNEFDIVAFVPLSTTMESSEAVGAIARSLGIVTGSADHRSALRDRIENQQLLLVLDNVEQLDPLSIGVSDLLASCPNLSVLVTSRSALNLRGEQLLDVSPLGCPPDGNRLDSEAALGYTAVALFVQRARAVRPEFDLEDRQVGAVVEICRRLDGLPLAIELAAIQMRHLSPPALLEKLKGGMHTGFIGPLDAPERQRTMAATIAWSYTLLDSEEQVLFRCLPRPSRGVLCPPSLGRVDTKVGDLICPPGQPTLMTQRSGSSSHRTLNRIQLRHNPTIRSSRCV
jgi:transcriptional regulator with XRE-family HTH domain